MTAKSDLAHPRSAIAVMFVATFFVRNPSGWIRLSLLVSAVSGWSLMWTIVSGALIWVAVDQSVRRLVRRRAPLLMKLHAFVLDERTPTRG